MRNNVSYFDALLELKQLEEKLGSQTFAIALLMREGLTLEEAETSYNAYIEIAK